MRSVKLGRCAMVFVGLVAVAATSSGADPLEQIKQTTTKILHIVTDPALKGPANAGKRKELILDLAEKHFDWQAMARRSLALHWTKRTEEEKKEFTDLFRRLVENTYLDKVEFYSGEKVAYVGEDVEGDYATVNVTITTANGTEIPVRYWLAVHDGEWLSYDVSIEGVSLVNNYRSQFNSIILRSGYKELVEKLKAKVGSQ